MLTYFVRGLSLLFALTLLPISSLGAVLSVCRGVEVGITLGRSMLAPILLCVCPYIPFRGNHSADIDRIAVNIDHGTSVDDGSLRCTITDLHLSSVWV